MRKRHIDDLGRLANGLAILLAVVFLVLPILVSVLMSFDGRSFLGPFPPPEFSVQWYESLFANDYFLKGFVTSVILASLATAISTGVGVCAALVLDRQVFAGKGLLSAFFLSPLMVPAVVTGFALVMFFGFVGVTDGFVRLLGGHVLITVPYTIRTTLAGLVGIRRSLLEAAMSLGATERQAFWDITFPLAKTAIMGGAVFALAFSFDDVPVSLFLSDPGSFTLPIALLGTMRSSFNLTIAAGAVVLVGFTIAWMFLLHWLIGLERIIGQGMYRN